MRFACAGSTLISVSFNIFLLVLVLGLNNQIGMGAIQYEIILAMGAYGQLTFLFRIYIHCSLLSNSITEEEYNYLEPTYYNH